MAKRPPTLRPFAAAQVEALKLLLNGAPLGPLQVRMAHEQFADYGRGLFLHRFPDGRMRSMQPPGYIQLADWQGDPFPLLPKAVADAISKALAEYDPKKSSVHLVISPSASNPMHGSYAWWVHTF